MLEMTFQLRRLTIPIAFITVFIIRHFPASCCTSMTLLILILFSGDDCKIKRRIESMYLRLLVFILPKQSAIHRSVAMPLEMQVVPISNPAHSFVKKKMVIKYFKGSCQLMEKECTLITGKLRL